MKDKIMHKVMLQLKSVALLVGVFIVTVSIAGAFGPGPLSVPPVVSSVDNPNVSAPISKNPRDQAKGLITIPGMSLSIFSQSNALFSVNVSDGTYLPTTQNSRGKEAIFNEKTMSLGDIATVVDPELVSANSGLFPFFEANLRDLGLAGGASWSQGAGVPDLIGASEPASADVIKLASGMDSSLSVNHINNQMTNIVLKRGCPPSGPCTAPMPRLTVESVALNSNDPLGQIVYAAVRAAGLLVDRVLVGNNIGDNILDSDNTKNYGAFDLNVEGTTNIGYGDTCQLYGYNRVASGCPDGWMMVAYESNCQAKCRQITTAKPLASLLVEGGRCPSLANPTSTAYLTDTAAIFDGASVGSVDDFPGQVISAAERLRCGLTPQCNDTLDNDGDVYTDYPNDPGCSSLTDNDEFNPPVYNIYDQGMIVYPGGTYRTASSSATVPAGQFVAQICTQNPVATQQNVTIGISVEKQHEPSTCAHLGLGPYPCGSASHSVSNIPVQIKAGQKCSVGVRYKLDNYEPPDITMVGYLGPSSPMIRIVPYNASTHYWSYGGGSVVYFSGIDPADYAGGTVGVAGTTGGNGAGGTLSVEPNFTGFP